MDNTSQEKGATSNPLFVQALKQTRERICEQVVDLRSTVIREACTTISALAQAMADAFHPFVEPILSALFKSVCVTIQVVSVSADTCIQNIIKSTQTGFAKAVPKYDIHPFLETKLIEGTKSKSQVLRFHCLEYLTLAWSIWDPSAFEKYVETMATILPILISDAQADVRSSARRCFWVFHKVHTIRANLVLESLDLSSKRRVMSDTSVPTVAAYSLPIASAASSLSQTNSQPVGPSRVNELPTSAPLRMGPRRVLAGIDNNSQVAKAPIPPRRVPVNSRKKLDDEDNYDEYTEVRRSLPGPQRVLYQSSNTPASNISESKPSGLSALPLRVEVTGKSENPRRKMAQDDNQMEERVSIPHLEKRAEDSMWNVRLESVKSLERAVAGVSSQEVSKIIKVAVARINDSHFLVAQSAMKLYHTLITMHPNLMEDNLKTMLPKIFAKLVDSKEGMRQQAANILESLTTSSFNASTLLQWIVPLMLDVPVKVKLHIYNFIASLLPEATEFCNNPALLRALVIKLADSIEQDQHTERGTISVVTNVLEKIIDLYGSSFSAILQQISPSKLALIQKCVSLQSSKLKRKHERQVAPLPPVIQSNNNSSQEPQPVPAVSSTDSLAVLWSNNATIHEKCLVMDEIVKTRCKLNDGMGIEWTRVLLAVLDLALEHCSEQNRVVHNRVMQTLKAILANPESSAFISSKIDSIIIPIVSRATNSSELGHYFVEKFLLMTLTTVPTSTCIRLLVALIKSPSQDHMQLQTVLKALHQTITSIPSNQSLRVGEYDLMATAAIPSLNHSKSVVRRMALMCMVGLYFLDDSKFVAYLQSLAPHVQKLVSLYIEKEQSQRNQR
ncbi:CLIP-associating protein [Thraustotheca clavata]|uniref:CLIP-associating protein n=1 Tax=Thraustotheca clavata TaxID=74557 RepID=A0A1W0A5S5_9STRA|nr:CLIP-associating protein [Thraustotheca clavata]